MRTQEVVYVPVPKNFDERMSDVAIRRTYKMLCQNGYSVPITGGISVLKDALGEDVYFECWTRNL